MHRLFGVMGGDVAVLVLGSLFRALGPELSSAGLKCGEHIF